MQNQIDNGNDERLIVLGDFNTRVGNGALHGITQVFNKETLNSRGETLIELCALNKLRINNTFFNHKPQHTFTNNRNNRS